MRGEPEYGKVEILSSGSMMDHRAQLGELLRIKSVIRVGRFTLSSGRESDYYVDCKLTTLDPKGAALTGYAILEVLEANDIHADAIGGPEIGAIPIVAAVSAVSYIRSLEGKGKPLPAFLVRKEHKSHGRQKQIEGIDLEKDPKPKVVVVDEVCTTGKSTWEALNAVEAAGLQVLAVMSLVDREEGGSESLRQHGYTYIPIFTARELREDDDLAAGETRQTAGHSIR